MSTITGYALNTGTESWQTSRDYQQEQVAFHLEKFLDVNDYLLQNPNLNSTHLFRADILYDSSNVLKTTFEKENACEILCQTERTSNDQDVDEGDSISKRSMTWIDVLPEGATVKRTVVRRLIPRKPQLDMPLDQSCFYCQLNSSTHSVIYVPHIKSADEVPWYHPPIRALAYVFETMPPDTTSNNSHCTISVHFLPLSEKAEASTERVHRTFISLLKTFVRLASNPSNPPSQVSNAQNGGTGPLEYPMTPASLKDTIIPQHIVQDTYTRLKQEYASDLINRWVESTEPTKHVFEDLAIAAFLIELWKQMYPPPARFPGFVDIACGNGVLVYILLHEGYLGKGFDARRRRTWDILGIDDALEERICIPQPFIDAVIGHTAHENKDSTVSGGMFPEMSILNGIFPQGTFIVSNHADELTPWTPILAALSSPANPLPFLAIPCCSHALSGAKHRYRPQDSYHSRRNTDEDMSKTGDLRALRKAKQKAANHEDDKSMYACLTRKVVSIAVEIGFDVELTLMRIPSTRNIGVVGNRKRVAIDSKEGQIDGTINRDGTLEAKMHGKIQGLLERECKLSGGIEAAARTWVDGARKLQKPRGRGKLNLGHKPEQVSEQDIGG